MGESTTKFEMIKSTDDGEWTMIKDEDKYGFIHNTGSNHRLVKTPKGLLLNTLYEDLADRILFDLSYYGYVYNIIDSILAWQFTLIDNFAEMSHVELEELLIDCFLRKEDWTFNLNNDNQEWVKIFGEKLSRKSEIERWLSKCSHMQMTAACCIGNAYHTLNVAYVLANLMENYEGENLDRKFNELADLIYCNSTYGPSEDMMNDFVTFKLYYGIHLLENGKIIGKDVENKN